MKLPFILSALFFIGALYYFASINKPGFYPPKKIMRKRAEGLAIVGGIFLLLGLFIQVFR